MSTDALIDALDNLLPQTQCGLCSYGACRPYAEAIAQKNEQINRCPPGGTKTLQELAKLMNQNPAPYLEEMQEKTKLPSVAVIREDECIGCTKCIQACPVDAIIGSAKKMHTVISTECTGCDLCVEPCPVDCIDMVAINPLSETLQKQKAQVARSRYQARQKRLLASPTIVAPEENADSRKTALQEAIERAKAKRDLQNER